MKDLMMLIGLFFIPLMICSQSQDLPDPEPYFSAMIVSNIDNSLDWYQEKLGFEILNRTDNAAIGLKQANLRRGNCLIELIELRSVLVQDTILADHPKGTRMAGFFKFGFTVSDFSSWVDHLEQAGADFHGQVVKDPISGKQTVILKDPDGNRIQLFER